MAEWREISEAPLYEVSNDGRVRNAATGRERKISTGGHGYRVITLRDAHHAERSFRVQRLVATAFLPNPAELPIVRHLDGNKVNNHVSNLAWGTSAENSADMVAHGTNHNLNKTHCVNGHEFTPENTKVRAGSRRECRECIREQHRQAYQRNGERIRMLQNARRRKREHGVEQD